MLTWKIVGVSKVSVIYIYIYIDDIYYMIMMCKFYIFFYYTRTDVNALRIIIMSLCIKYSDTIRLAY